MQHTGSLLTGSLQGPCSSLYKILLKQAYLARNFANDFSRSQGHGFVNVCLISGQQTLPSQGTAQGDLFIVTRAESKQLPSFQVELGVAGVANPQIVGGRESQGRSAIPHGTRTKPSGPETDYLLAKTIAPKMQRLANVLLNLYIDMEPCHTEVRFLDNWQGHLLGEIQRR